MVQAMLSAPRPFRSNSPATKMPTDQLVKIRLTKKAASAKPERPQIESEEAMASNDTGIMPIDSRTMLMIISAARNSDRPQRRHHQVAEVARVHFLEERNRETELAAEQNIPQQHRADEDAAGRAKKPAFCEM